MSSLTAATTAAKRFLACENEGVTVTLPKPITSGAKRFGKQDFRYVAEEDVYICPAGKRLAYSFTTQEHGLVLHRYLTNVCQHCAIKHRCTTGKERRITRWEHEHILEAVQRRLDEHPEKMRQRRETVERDHQNLCVRPGYAVMSSRICSLNMTANCVFASAHSRGGRFHSAVARFKTKYNSFVAASSEGKCPLVLTARRSLEFSASMAFVV